MTDETNGGFTPPIWLILLIVIGGSLLLICILLYCMHLVRRDVEHEAHGLAHAFNSQSPRTSLVPNHHGGSKDGKKQLGEMV